MNSTTKVPPPSSSIAEMCMGDFRTIPHPTSGVADNKPGA